MGDKLIINVAMTGLVPTREASPHVPLTPQEIAADARRCRDAGASIMHIHARDHMGKPTYRREINQAILRAVRESCPDLILCVSTSGRAFKSYEERSEVLDVQSPQPEMASLTLGSMNFAREASVNDPQMIKALALRMRKCGITPELECFEVGMVEYIHYLLRHDILQAPGYCNLLLGSLGTISATRANLEAMVKALPRGFTWAAAGIGRYQYGMNTLAITLGGHVRVGLEDNLYFDEARTQLATNAALVERLVTFAEAAGRAIATPDEARALIGLPSREAEALETCEIGA
ncbi:MAG: beta-keto acid cleavage family enzyme [Armatimonadota bacterium]